MLKYIETREVTEVAKENGIRYLRVYTNTYKDGSYKRVKFYGVQARAIDFLIKKLHQKFPRAIITPKCAYLKSVTIYLPLSEKIF